MEDWKKKGMAEFELAAKGASESFSLYISSMTMIPIVAATIASSAKEAVGSGVDPKSHAVEKLHELLNKSSGHNADFVLKVIGGLNET